MAIHPEFAIVVARYNEDLTWLKPYADVVHIQNKGDERTIPDVFRSRKTLPNIGREAHSYLDYIISNYDDLPKNILFIQGNIEDHRDTFYLPFTPDVKVISSLEENHPSVEQLIPLWKKQIEEYGRTCNAKSFLFPNGKLAAMYGLRHSAFYSHLFPSEYTFGQWFERYILPRFPDKLLWFKNALFGCERRCILSRPKKYYEDLLAQLKYTNCDLAYYFERSWYYILNMQESHPLRV